jgi:CheY-like chemotaxis protein
VRIEVWDTGPGISDGDRQTIFEEFQRGAAADRPTIGGFGLGLSIVQRMADALGHPLGLCSRIGHGTRFSVTAERATLPEVASASPGSPIHARGLGLSGARVVVIDNDPGVLEAMQALLHRWDCNVCAARNLAGLSGADAEDFQPDIILADYHLDDGRNGLEAVSLLRQRAGSAVPAVVITADRAPAVADAVRALGCELLLKPAKPAALRALMQHLLSHAPQPAAG